MEHLYLVEFVIKDNFYPFSHYRSLSNMRVGIFTLLEKWQRISGLEPSKISVIEKEEGDAQDNQLRVSLAAIPSNDLIIELNKLNKNHHLYTSDDIWIGGKGEQKSKIVAPENIKVAKYPWDWLTMLGEEIENDIEIANLEPLKNAPEGVHYFGLKDVHIGKNVTIRPGVVLNTLDGPIVLDDNCVVEELSVIQGPVYVGKNATVKAQGKISAGTVISENCKVGGEVNNVLFMEYSNKAHDGYLGNSVVGSWCNIGAGSTSSNLRNDYAEVPAYSFKDQKEVLTGRQFFGCLMGDHSKLAIGTLLNTGTVIGVSCNLFGAEFQNRFIPSFTWGKPGKYLPFRLSKAIEVIQAMMKRRNRDLSESEKEILSYIYDSEQGE